jgi:HD-GYP domain-containing protein (c-di-GMP phosphodiesterase class II)
MTGGEHYKEALTVQEAAAELTSKAGSQFDKHIVQVFLEVVV